MDNSARDYIYSSTSSLLKVNRALQDMLKTVRTMDSPKHTKAETKKELLEKLHNIGEEMHNLSQKASSYFPESKPANIYDGSKT